MAARYNQGSMSQPSVVAQGYDAVYEVMPRSPTFLSLWKEHAAGQDYPDAFSHISFITLEDLRHLAGALRLSEGSTFADLACGMGGPGLWVARETGARLVGVDFSRVAVVRAAERAEAAGLNSVAWFQSGSFAETGLKTASMDAAMSVDALQYAPDKRAAMREFARVVRPGGRLAFFAFELDPERSRDLPIIGEDPVDDYRPLLKEASFRVLTYEQTPHWHQRLLAAYGGVIEAQQALRREMGEVATAAMLSEMTVTLQRDIYRGRVFALAERR